MSEFQEQPSKQRKNILVTGGTGYIGIHTIVSLIEADYDVTVVDNLSNSSSECLNRVPLITGCDISRIRFYEVDIRDYLGLEKVFQDRDGMEPFAACIHFAGLKAVGESVAKPVLYYENNVGGTFNLLNLMDKYHCPSFVFSSSATVYGAAEVPINEESPTGSGITNAYGRTKYMIEEILMDYKTSKELAKKQGTGSSSNTTPCSVVILRYFNPVGAHPSGIIGEDPNGIPNNLMPYVAQVVVGRREKLTIFGGDYPTKDGTGVRDYIHVMDLADGHVAALKYIDAADAKGHDKLSIFNLGTGHGYSVLDLVHSMEKASGKPLPHVIGARRPGDIAICYADPSLATRELGWSATRGLDEMCRDVYNWQSKNPNGYKPHA